MTPLLEASGLVVVGLLVLTLGADALVRGAGALALRIGLSALVVGLTVVAFGTSSPEFAISGEAALSGDSSIALGNVVGSNLFNLAVILGVAALVAPLPASRALVRRDLPVVLGGTLLAGLFLLDGVVARWEGAVLFTGLAGYIAFSIRASRTEARINVADETDEMRAAAEAARGPMWRALVLLAGGLVALVVGAGWLLDGAVSIAQAFGVSPAVIALTLVAAGTSLPELATSVVAARRGQSEIALGNVVGSSTFNVLGVLGLAAMLRPVEQGGVTWLSLGAVAGVTLLAVGLAAVRGRFGRLEGALLLTSYAVYAVTLVR